MLEIKNLNFSYNDSQKVIKNLSLNISSNSLNAIIGKNGSGKSTLSLILAGILYPDSGEVNLEGNTLNPNDVSVVFQNPLEQFVRPNVYSDLAFGLENKNIKVKDIHEQIYNIARTFDALELVNRDISGLSGGELQIVALLGALLMKPKILILDEAIDMIDPEKKHFILTELKLFAKTYDIIIVYITHDMELTLEMDNVIVLKEGVLYENGDPISIFNDKKLVEENNLEIPDSIQLIKQIEGEYQKINLEDFGDKYEPKIK